MTLMLLVAAAASLLPLVGTLEAAVAAPLTASEVDAPPAAAMVHPSPSPVHAFVPSIATGSEGFDADMPDWSRYGQRLLPIDANPAPSDTGIPRTNRASHDADETISVAPRRESESDPLIESALADAGFTSPFAGSQVGSTGTREGGLSPPVQHVTFADDPCCDRSESHPVPDGAASGGYIAAGSVLALVALGLVALLLGAGRPAHRRHRRTARMG